jgi:hypothetical protein
LYKAGTGYVNEEIAVFDSKEELTMANLWDSLDLNAGVPPWYKTISTVTKQWEILRDDKDYTNRLPSNEGVYREGSVERCWITHFLSKFSLTDIFELQTRSFYMVLYGHRRPGVTYVESAVAASSTFNPLIRAIKQYEAQHPSITAVSPAAVQTATATIAAIEKEPMVDVKIALKQPVSIFGLPVVPLDFVTKFGPKPPPPTGGGQHLTRIRPQIWTRRRPSYLFF